MGNSGFILRFVDVVLILLFGFISISEIKQSEIELPKSSETARTLIDREEVIYVGVLHSGVYLVEDETVALDSRGALRAYLASERSRYGDVPVKVRLRSSFDAPVRHVIAAAQLCDEMGIRKAIDVQVQLGQ